MHSYDQAFRDAFEQYSDDLFRHCVLRLSDRERALDLTQESFLRAWEYIRKGNVIEQFRPFLYRILHNLIIDEYRKHKTYSLDAMLENEETATAVEAKFLRSDSDMVEEASIRFDTEVVLKAVKLLPELYRTVVLMRFVDNLSPCEIARCLKEKEDTISVRIHRGVGKLKVLLSSQMLVEQ